MSDVVTDLSELCRLCLDTSSVFISFETPVPFSTRTIPSLISYCLDVNCNIKDDGILPNNICESCLQKLQIAFELKTKSKESDKYLKEILKSASIEDAPTTSNNFVAVEVDDHYDLLEQLDPALVRTIDQERNVANPVLQLKQSGPLVCPHCGKTYKSKKPYNNHIKMHKGNRNISNHRVMFNETPNQPPYDPDQSPYGSLAHFETSRTRNSSPELTTMLLESNFQNGNNGEATPSKRLRSRRTLSPSKSLSLEPTPEPVSTQRGRGRPRKKPREASEEQNRNVENEKQPSPEVHPDKALRGRGRRRKQQLDPVFEKEESSEKSSEEEEGAVPPGFSEVDVRSMLKSKPISFVDDPILQSTQIKESRSRSASLEVVQEFDIFGTGISPEKPQRKIEFSSGNTFSCEKKNCTKKFHLKANLKKHQREAHGMK